MNKYIATWVYLDSPDEKSNYPNTGGNSSSSEFQNVYWRCIVVFYKTSLRFHADVQHLFFTNSDVIPIVDGLNIESFFKENNIEVVTLKNIYPVPENYFGSFRNQFFEFSIIDHIAKNTKEKDMLILLDSDCVFTNSINTAFETLQQSTATALTYVVIYKKDYKIHGVSGNQMRKLFKDFGVVLDENPFYSGGELLFAKSAFFKGVSEHFPELYRNLIHRHENKLSKFNEEAHVLSYYYYRFNSIVGGMDDYIKRIWTDQNVFRNVKKDDIKLPIWHLPSEKRLGIYHMFLLIVKGEINLMELAQDNYIELLTSKLIEESNHKLGFRQKLKSLFKSFSK